jgi:hypothetical protein
MIRRSRPKPRYLLEVPLAEDDDVIESFAPDAAKEPLADRIHEREPTRLSE